MTKAEADHIKKELKKVLRQYRTMTASIRRKLYALGFTTRMAGRHVKVYFGSDTSHCVVMSCISSDVNSGLNTVSEIYRLLVLNITPFQSHPIRS